MQNPASENLRVRGCAFCQSRDERPGTAMSMVSLVSTAIAAAAPADTCIHRCWRGEDASTKASRIQKTARLSRKTSRCKVTESGESAKTTPVAAAVQRDPDIRLAST